MDNENQILERRVYSLKLRHQICKEHINEGAKLADLVRKYQIKQPLFNPRMVKAIGLFTGY